MKKLGWGLCLLLLSSHGALHAEKDPTFFVLADVGARSVSSEDANRTFDYSKNGYAKPALGNLTPLVLGLSGGYFFSPKFAAELGLEIGPNRNFEMTYQNSGGASIYKEQIETKVATLFFMPEIAFKSGGVFSGMGLHTIGLRLGSAALSGTETDTNLTNSLSGKFNFDSSTFTYGLVYRFVDFVSGGLGLGVELSYDYLRFSTINVKEPSGAYAGATITNPAKNPDGSQAFVDGSGLSLKLVLGGWGFDSHSKDPEDNLSDWAR